MMSDFRTCYQCDASWGPGSELAGETCPDCGTRLHVGLMAVPLRHLRIRMLGRDEHRQSLAKLSELVAGLSGPGFQ